MSPFHNPFGFSGFGFGINSNSGLALPPSAYHRRSSSVPLPLSQASDSFPSMGGYSFQLRDLGAIALPSIPYISQTRPTSPINNISQQQRSLLGSRRASSAQPVFRRSWTQSFYPTPNSNPFSIGNSFANQDFSGYDWTSINIPVTVPSNGTVERDDSPLPEVELEFNGFSFGDGAVDGTNSLSVNTLSTSVSSSSIS